jgi:hypothetical protein
MDDQRIRIFNAISTFVGDLHNVFEKNKLIALYFRLIEKTTIRDFQAIDRHVAAFKTFFEENVDYVESRTITSEKIIYTKDHVYIDVPLILSLSDSDTQKAIHQHLLTIYSLCYLNTEAGQKALDALKELKTTQNAFDLKLPDTTEGKFLEKTLNKMSEQLKDSDTNNINPVQMAATMMSNGFLGEFMGDMSSKFKSGEMTLPGLFQTITTVIQTAGPSPGGAESAQLQNLMSQFSQMIPQMAGGGGAGAGAGAPPNIQDLMSQLMPQMPPMPPMPAEIRQGDQKALVPKQKKKHHK